MEIVVHNETTYLLIDLKFYTYLYINVFSVLDSIIYSNYFVNINKYNFFGNYRSLSTTPAYCSESKLYFTKKHEWVSILENMGTVGITDYAQQALGKINKLLS